MATDDGERTRWSLLLLREDGARAGRWSFRPGAAWAVAAAAALLLLAVGAAAGVWWAERSADARAEALASRVEALRAERGRVRTLAARLESVETSYRRLRRIMGGEVAPSERDVRLPPPGDAGTGGTRTEAPVDGRAEPGWRWPLARRGFVTRAFDDGGAPGHPGIDVAVPSGSYVRAARSGVVAEAGRDSVYGRFLRLDHGGGSATLYAHASHLFVGAGDTVEGGEVIALTGSTGRSSAPHLHVELQREGRAVNPARLLRGGTEGPQGLQGPDEGGDG